MRTIQIVIDTNVFVAALRSRLGASFRLISLIGTAREFELNVSVPLVLEYEELAHRQQPVHGLSTDEIDAIIDYLCLVANRHEIFYLWRPFLNDSGDDMVLEIAVQAGCDYIVSFNIRDFARVQAQFGIRVVTPAEFLREVGLHEHDKP